MVLDFLNGLLGIVLVSVDGVWVVPMFVIFFSSSFNLRLKSLCLTFLFDGLSMSLGWAELVCSI